MSKAHDAILASLDKPATAADIRAATGLCERTSHWALRALLDRGAVEIRSFVRTGKTTANVFARKTGINA